MLAAVKEGDVKKVAELMRQDPGFDVNVDQDGDGCTLLHFACYDSKRSAVIPLLLAHPDIDVNVKDMDEWTPFYWACYGGYTSCVREMLKDSRVKLNEPRNDGCTPLRDAAANGHVGVIKWWIVSGREMDSRETRGMGDGCHWGGNEARLCRRGHPAGEIQERCQQDQTCDEGGTWSD